MSSALRATDSVPSMPLSSRRKWMWAGLLCLPAIWLIGDALYALNIRMRADDPNVPHASTEPFTLNPGGSPAVLLIHGFADGPSVFAQVAPPLAEAGFAVRAMHLDGFGVPTAEMEGITLTRWRKNVDSEIAAFQITTPDRPLWLVGHSLGASLAFDAALRPENHIAGLVLIAPLIQPSNIRSPLLSSRQWFKLLGESLLFTEIVESRLPPDLHDPVARAHYQTDKFIHRDIYTALFDTIDAVGPRAADWHGPLLMIVSPSDQIVYTPASTKFFFEATNAHPTRLSEHHAGGHVLPLDKGHESITRQVIRFISNNTENEVNGLD